MDKIRVGVVGCGEIAQIMHLPYLTSLAGFEVTAVCDISPNVLEAVANRFHINNRTTDYTEIIVRDDVDAVLIANMDHADVAVAAAEAGKHLFIEKPLCFTLEEADRILKAAEANNVTLMVGYMKRYDPGYVHGAKLMQEMEDVRLIRVHDLSGDFGLHGPLYETVRANDIPEEATKRQQASINAKLESAVGASHAQFKDIYFTLLMLCSHDLTVLRGAFGAPKAVSYTDVISQFELVSVLDYGNARCVFEAGIYPEYQWWDEHITAYGKREIVSVIFPNPYVQYAPTRVVVQGDENGVPVNKDMPVTHQEAFKLEWQHFYDCVTEGIEPLTNGRDAKADIELAIEIVRAVRI